MTTETAAKTHEAAAAFWRALASSPNTPDPAAMAQGRAASQLAAELTTQLSEWGIMATQHTLIALVGAGNGRDPAQIAQAHEDAASSLRAEE